jgi:hypothetical protein
MGAVKALLDNGVFSLLRLILAFAIYGLFFPAFCRSVFWLGVCAVRKEAAIDELKKLRSNFDLSWTGGGEGSGGTMGDNALPNARVRGWQQLRVNGQIAILAFVTGRCFYKQGVGRYDEASGCDKAGSTLALGRVYAWVALYSCAVDGFAYPDGLG